MSANDADVSKDATRMLEDPDTSKPKQRSPLEHVAEHANRVSQMCDMLEALADDLPRRTAPVWREATRMCNDVIPGHYHDVLCLLVPILLKRTEGDVDCEDLLQRLRLDFEDEAYRLTELNDLMVDAVGADAKKIGPEALGYALRGFFGALRRNTSWETDVLLPLAERYLNSDDLEEISGQLTPFEVAKPH
ncbi:MAG: hypothetical protein AAFR49_07915 [Pseudomonadota bacterium]